MIYNIDFSPRANTNRQPYRVVHWGAAFFQYYPLQFIFMNENDSLENSHELFETDERMREYSVVFLTIR
jgi:hypothetical protein